MEIFGDAAVPLFTLRLLSAKKEKIGEISEFYSQAKQFAALRKRDFIIKTMMNYAVIIEFLKK